MVDNNFLSIRTLIKICDIASEKKEHKNNVTQVETKITIFDEA